MTLDRKIFGVISVGIMTLGTWTIGILSTYCHSVEQ
jgi:hypothetical protein